ncbi:hypothetical protein IIY66_01960 [Candidatus Saccharibacteria bacterium]|nr:hypothetical protein [Candidatus Saccharibacteria bacterium]
MSMECNVLINWNFYFENPQFQVSFYDFFAEFIRSKRKKLRTPSEYEAHLVGNMLNEDGVTYGKRTVCTAQVIYIKKVGCKEYAKKTGLGEHNVIGVRNIYCIKTQDKRKFYLRLRDLSSEAVYRVNYINNTSS